MGLPLLLPWPLDRPHLYLVGAWGPPQQMGCGWGGHLPGQPPPQMGLHVAGQLGRDLAGHAAGLHRMWSARGAQSPGSCTTWMFRFAAVGESFVAELTDQVRALAVHLQVVRNIS